MRRGLETRSALASVIEASGLIMNQRRHGARIQRGRLQRVQLSARCAKERFILLRKYSASPLVGRGAKLETVELFSLGVSDCGLALTNSLRSI